MRPSRRLAGLVLAALLGVAVVLVLLAHAVAGAVAAAATGAVLIGLTGIGAARVRRATAPRPASHCTCCDGDHTAPVQVV